MLPGNKALSLRKKISNGGDFQENISDHFVQKNKGFLEALIFDFVILSKLFSTPPKQNIF